MKRHHKPAYADAKSDSNMIEAMVVMSFGKGEPVHMYTESSFTVGNAACVAYVVLLSSQDSVRGTLASIPS